jgi:hypothetical protein
MSQYKRRFPGPGRYLLGLADVDSGTIRIGDPCYTTPSRDPLSDPAKPWEEITDLTFTPDTDGKIGIPIVAEPNGRGQGIDFSSGIGDGSYAVVADVVEDPDWGQRIARVTIDFGLIEDDFVESASEMP